MVTEVAQGLPPIMRLRLFPATLKQANEMIELFHRHHKRAVGHRFSIGCKDQSGIIHGIAAIINEPWGIVFQLVAKINRV